MLPADVPPFALSSNPVEATCEQEMNWVRAEEATSEIVCRIHPTVEANSRRKSVIAYVQALIKSSFGLEVLPYGSVPLMTFLPDGDIDLTVIFSSLEIEETSLVSNIHALLGEEEDNADAPYEVKKVHCIEAEVKLIKCVVQDLEVDISFNQLGGLSTLCFLELVDQLVGKSHLFKRSIILIKAWCYYESRILGAPHGLLSTYALEILILYIFQHFHSTLNGPLMVLNKFLDYFSKFDWENYCVTLSGPILISSMTDNSAKVSQDAKDGLLLSDEFLRKCADMLSVPGKTVEINPQTKFPVKNLNILDPLKENNNLGRSINRGSYYRVRSAFNHGATKLGRTLLSPIEEIAPELNRFFANALDRSGREYWTTDNNPNSSSSSESVATIPDSPPSSLAPSHYDVLSKCRDVLLLTDEMSCTSLKEHRSCTDHACASSFYSSTSTPADKDSENPSPSLGEKNHSCNPGDSQSENRTWSPVHPSLSFRHYVTSQMQNSNIFGPQIHFVRPLAQFSASANDKNKQGTGAYIPNMTSSAAFCSEEKKRGGTGVYLSSMVDSKDPIAASCHEERKKQGIAAICSEEKRKRGTGAYIPKVVSDAVLKSEEKINQRGTGAYIPNMACCTATPKAKRKERIKAWNG